MDPDRGPFQYTTRVLYGPDSKLANCALGADACDQLDCVSNDLLFFCEIGGRFDSELKATSEQLCNAQHHELCQVCDLVKLDGMGGCPQDPSCQTSDPLGCCKNTAPQCCGQNPGDPPTPFLKDAAGNPSVRLASSPVTVTIEDEVGTTTADGAHVDYMLSNCANGACDIQFSLVNALPADFTLAGRHFTGVIVESGHPFTGRIDSASGLFAVPAGAMSIYAYFIVDDKPGSIVVVNSDQVVGFANPTANAFRLAGTASGTFDGSPVSITLSLNGAFENKGPPVPVITGPDTVECASPDGTEVTLDATSTTDPDGVSLRYFWYEESQKVASGPSVQLQLPVGTTTIELAALDEDARQSKTKAITVQDTTAPVISAAVNPSCLWPPNHKLFCFSIGDEIEAQVSDACGSAPTNVIITGTTSNDASTSFDDIQITSDTVCLRAERGSHARTYTIQLSSTDSFGNVGTTSVTVEVPHDNHSHCGNSAFAARLREGAEQ